MIELCLTNLGKYNEGELIFTRLVLPATTEEIYAAYDEIGVAEGTMYEETFISDYETDINGLEIREFANLDDLNELAEELEKLDEYELEAFGAMLDYGLATDEALQKVQDGEYSFYEGCNSMEDVAYQYADETGLLNSIPDDLRCYFDFEAFGRDMDISVMLQCSCHYCKNRQIGCHKFCPDYRKYRRELEEVQAKQKEEKESSKDYFRSLLKNNFRRK